MTGIWRNKKNHECVVASRLGYDPAGTYFYRSLRQRNMLNFKEDENFNCIINLFNKTYKTSSSPYFGLRDNKIYIIDGARFYNDFEYICKEPIEVTYNKKIFNLFETLKDSIKDYFIIEVLK